LGGRLHKEREQIDHRKAVKEAIEKGENVPDYVLKEYENLRPPEARKVERFKELQTYSDLVEEFSRGGEMERLEQYAGEKDAFFADLLTGKLGDAEKVAKEAKVDVEYVKDVMAELGPHAENIRKAEAARRDAAYATFDVDIRTGERLDDTGGSGDFTLFSGLAAVKGMTAPIRRAGAQIARWKALTFPNWTQSVKVVRAMAPKAGNKLARLLEDLSDATAAFGGPLHRKYDEILSSVRTSEYENLFMSKAGKETPKNDRVARALQRLENLDKFVTDLAQTVGVRMADGSRFRPLKNHIPQEWNDRARKDIAKHAGKHWDEAIQVVANKLESEGLTYEPPRKHQKRGKIKKWNQQLFGRKGRTRKQIEKEAEEWLRDNRDWLPNGEPVLNPLQDTHMKSPVAGTVQLHRLIEWPRHFLADNMAGAYLRHLNRMAKKIGEATVLGGDNKMLVKRYEEFVREAERGAEGRRDVAQTRLIAEEIARKLIGRELGNKELGGIDRTILPEGAYDYLKLGSAMLHLGPGSRFHLVGNMAYGLFMSQLRYGLHRALPKMVKNLPIAFMDYPGLKHIPGIKNNRAYLQAVERGALEHQGLISLVGDAPIPPALKSVLTGFIMGTEAWLRTSASEAGRDYTRDAIKTLHKRYTKAQKQGRRPGDAVVNTPEFRQLKDMGLTAGQIIYGAKFGKISEAALNRASRGAVEVTQFKTRAIDLPLIMSTPGGKVFFQFTPMAYKQFQNTILYSARELGYGHLAPALNVMAMGYLFGWGMQQFGNWLYGREQDDEDVNALVSAMNMIQDSVGLIDKPMHVFESQSANQLLRAVAPVSVTDIAALITNSNRLMREVIDTARGEKDADVGRAARGLQRMSASGRALDTFLSRRGVSTPYTCARRPVLYGLCRVL
jgi:hypothetical protein